MSEKRLHNAAKAPKPKARAYSERREALALFFSNPHGVFGLVLVILFFTSAIFAPLIAPFDPYKLDIPVRLSGPTWEHFVGTDQLGRDTFSRVLYGGRVALKIAAIGVSVAFIVGLLLGMTAVRLATEPPTHPPPANAPSTDWWIILVVLVLPIIACVSAIVPALSATAKDPAALLREEG